MYSRPCWRRSLFPLGRCSLFSCLIIIFHYFLCCSVYIKEFIAWDPETVDTVDIKARVTLLETRAEARALQLVHLVIPGFDPVLDEPKEALDEETAKNLKYMWPMEYQNWDKYYQLYRTGEMSIKSGFSSIRTVLTLEKRSDTIWQGKFNNLEAYCKEHDMTEREFAKQCEAEDKVKKKQKTKAGPSGVRKESADMKLLRTKLTEALAARRDANNSANDAERERDTMKEQLELLQEEVKDAKKETGRAKKLLNMVFTKHTSCAAKLDALTPDAFPHASPAAARYLLSDDQMARVNAFLVGEPEPPEATPSQIGSTGNVSLTSGGASV